MKRNSRQAAPNESPAEDLPPMPWNWTVDFSRQWFPVASQAADVMMRGFEQMRELQAEALRDVGKQESGVAERFGRHPDPVGLMAVQMDLMRSRYERGMRYWMDVAGTAMEIQTELAACGARLVNTEDALAATRILRT